MRLGLSGPHLIALGFSGALAGNLAAFTGDRLAANARDHSDTCPPNALQVNQSISIGGQPGVLLGWSCGALVDQAITVYARQRRCGGGFGPVAVTF